jgi:hypothetical protein
MQHTSYSLNDTMMIEVNGHIPTCILPDYWTRHHLSRKDVDTIVAYIPTKIIWLCAMIYGITVPWYSLRSSSSTTMGITMSSKAVALDLILDKVGIKLDSQNRLDTESLESLDHIPPIPKYMISKTDYSLISSGITNDLLPTSLLLPSDSVGIIPIIYSYLNLEWVPVGIEGDSICCNAVVPYKVIQNDMTSEFRRGLTHDPKVGIYNENLYSLTDELILFSTK